ncbi:hypothetical protein Psch_01741 [Pelotomaculum schinkii]|uniref:Uncharacterized protein n=1 Tax=Pelotomaculum schinkii TaxID=78350 RepID=A0A4Y7RH87_9FIRM|nr:hypothetical protein Psch_01741 [Pelotomaculum schinkii]TEB14233.1 hypothetical protein Psfp_03054 [Pelotomaculum sp. FP]
MENLLWPRPAALNHFITMKIIEECKCAIQTANGCFLTAVNKGGMDEPANRLPIHTDATKIDIWEMFEVRELHNGS